MNNNQRSRKRKRRRWRIKKNKTKFMKIFVKTKGNQIYYIPYQMKQAKNEMRREKKIVVHADRIYNQFALKRWFFSFSLSSSRSLALHSYCCLNYSYSYYCCCCRGYCCWFQFIWDSVGWVFCQMFVSLSVCAFVCLCDSFAETNYIARETVYNHKNNRKSTLVVKCMIIFYHELTRWLAGWLVQSACV